MVVVDLAVLPENKLYMTALLNNLKIEEKVQKNKPHTSSFVFHHLPAGIGVVLGNYFRQFLLKYTSSIAPLGAQISHREGVVESEMSILPGVVDTVATSFLIMNLKEVRVEAKKKEGVFWLELNVENKEKKEKKITAADFQKDKEVKIKNPNLHLATLAAATDEGKNPKLEVKLYFQKNWGYHEEEEQEKNYLADEENVIAFSTDYAPVKGDGVSFQIKSVVIGREKTEEELMLTITTNGVVEPKEALQEVLAISQDAFGRIFQLVNDNSKKGEKLILEPTAETKI
ncbi:MAG: DNA-directed RNA polymerase subunit alpha [Mycoplasmataceae bacterium RV_VA103A]|nr:MAG: DNA-directed RNA polymerase subunit alpha [Mycoplasmataceae bacterium RV_VA103A]